MLKSFMLYVFSPLIILCASLCCPEEREPDYEEFSVIVPENISIGDDQKVFSIGDTLWINVEIPNQLIDAKGQQIDINSLTGATTAQANFILLLETQFENSAKIALSENEIINILGLLIPESYESQLRSQAVLTDDIFRARHGIVLRQSGTFTLRHANPNAISYWFSTYYNYDLINNVTVETSFRSSSISNEYTFQVTN